MTELQPQDLRLGNYIISGNNGTFLPDGTIGKVLSIGEEDSEFEQIYCECEESFDWFFKGNYFGISLTEEWLINFGFEKLDCGDLYYELKSHCGILKDNDGICLVEDFCHEGIKVNCEHVHQLQNLYHSLTGTDLKQKK